MELIASICRRPVGSLVVCACLALLGAVSCLHIQINLYPQTRYPALTVTTVLSDSDPEEIETLITRNLEETLVDLPGLKKITSNSRQGNSQVTLEFHEGHDISDLALEVRGRIRRLWPSFPKDTRFPVISHYNPSDDPLVVLGVTGTMPLPDLSHWAEHTLKPQLNRLDGVASVQIAGATVREIQADCDMDRLNALGLTVREVAHAISTGHRTLSAGFLTRGEKRLPLRPTGNLENATQVSDQPLTVSQEGAVVRVRDVARVELRNKEPKEITRLNGQSLVSVAIYRTNDSDLRRLWGSLPREDSGYTSLGSVWSKHSGHL